MGEGFFIRLLGSAMFTATFNSVTRVRLVFGTLKDGSLLIDSLASNNRFSYRNFQNGVDALSKKS